MKQPGLKTAARLWLSKYDKKIHLRHSSPFLTWEDVELAFLAGATWQRLKDRRNRNAKS